MLYTSLSNKKIKEIKKLHLKKYRDSNNKFIIEGPHLVLEAFRSGYLEELLLEKDQIFPLPIETNYITKDIINYLTLLEDPTNIIGICRKKDQNFDIGNKILFLDNVQDPGNFGTIIRSAVAFSFDTIIIKDGVDIYNEKVIRATQGMFFHINILQVKTYDILENLKNEEYKITGTRVNYGKSLKDIEKSKKFVIIVGNEGSGLSESAQEYCQEFIYIPINDICESLNVGVATSIILYELDK